MRNSSVVPFVGTGDALSGYCDLLFSSLPRSDQRRWAFVASIPLENVRFQLVAMELACVAPTANYVRRPDLCERQRELTSMPQREFARCVLRE